jgi:hypothetical protein
LPQGDLYIRPGIDIAASLIALDPGDIPLGVTLDLLLRGDSKPSGVPGRPKPNASSDIFLGKDAVLCVPVCGEARPAVSSIVRLTGVDFEMLMGDLAAEDGLSTRWSYGDAVLAAEVGVLKDMVV